MNPYVGSMGITGREIFGGTARNNYEAWFAGANVTYVHSARTAIQRTFALLNLRAGDEILVPSYHCGSEVDALLKAGACVRLFRILQTGEIDIDDLQSRITRATKAVYAIHYFGFPQRLSPISEICQRRGLYLIEDCALSPLTELEGRRIGFWGDVAVYNFPKSLPVPDGGALVVNNPNLQNQPWRLQSPGAFAVLGNVLRLFRQTVLRHLPPASVRLLFKLRATCRGEAGVSSGRRGMPPSYYFHPSMSNKAWSKPSAWLMRRMDLSEVRRRRRRNFSQLTNCLSPVPGLKLLFPELPAGVCPLCLPVLVPEAGPTARRLWAQSVPAVAWWAGYHRDGLNGSEFPEACHLKDHVVALPIHQQLDDTAMKFIGQTLVECLAAT